MKDPFGSSLFVSSSNVEIRPLQRAFHKTTASFDILLVIIGGMKGVAITDAAQGVFMFAGLLGGSLWVILANFPSVAVPTKQRSLIRRNSSQCRGQTAS